MSPLGRWAFVGGGLRLAASSLSWTNHRAALPLAMDDPGWPRPRPRPRRRGFNFHLQVSRRVVPLRLHGDASAGETSSRAAKLAFSPASRDASHHVWHFIYGFCSH